MKCDLYDNLGGYWSEHPKFPVADWQYAVANGDTREGYWEWVESELSEPEITGMMEG